jgi:hypothetical protein
VPLVAVEQDRPGLAAVAHLGVFHADPPIAGHAAAQRRRRAGQVHVLVADLAGGRDRRGRGLIASPAGHERLDLIEQPQHLSQALIPCRRIVSVPVEGGLQAGGRQLTHPRQAGHHRGPRSSWCATSPRPSTTWPWSPPT